MKLAKIILCIVAMGAMVMTSCKKDESATVAGDNEVVIDGTVYKLYSYIQTEGGSPRYMDCYNTDKPDEGVTYRFIGDVSNTNLTADLTSASAGLYMFHFEHKTEPAKSFQQGLNPDGWSGANHIGTKEYGEQSIFKSGTISIKLDKTALTYKVDGTLKDDRKVSVKVMVPVKDFTQVPWELQQ